MQYYRNALLIVGLLALTLVGCDGQATPDASEEPVVVLSQSIKATGVVVPETVTNISFPINGKIVEVPVEAGDEVQQNAVLAQLDDIDLVRGVKIAELQVEEAKVNLTIAQNELDRVVKWSPNSNSVAAAEAALNNAEASLKIAQAEYDKVAWVPSVSSTGQSLQLEQATNNFDVAQANLNYVYTNRPDTKRAAENLRLADLAFKRSEINQEIAEEALKRAILRAPFDGTVNEVYIHEGEIVTPGTPVMLIADLSTLRVETTDLNENDVVKVAIGDKVIVTFEALPDVQIEGKVEKIGSKAAEGVGVNYTITIELDEIPEVVRWGMTAYIEIPLE